MSAARRVVHMTSVHTPTDTRIFRKECQTLARAGYDVGLVAPRAGNETRSGVRFMEVAAPRGRLQRVTRTGAAVVRRALREKADVYHVHDPELLPWAALLRLGGRRVVFDMHENVPAAIRSRPWIPGRFRALAGGAYRLFERILLPRLPVIFAEHSYRSHYRWVREHTTVLNFPDLSGIPDGRADRRSAPTLVYLGAVSSDRGSSVTLAALDLLRAQGVDARWECIGPIANPRDAEELSAARHRLGQEALSLRGKLLQEEALSIAAECHVGLAILQPVPNYVESYPTKLFEYMALGLPVVVSDFPLYRGVVEKEACGICVDPRDERAVAAAVRWLLEHPDEARAMGERGRHAARTRYNWAGEGRKLLSFYARLLDGR